MKKAPTMLLMALLAAWACQPGLRADGPAWPSLEGLDLEGDPSIAARPLSAKEEEALRLAAEFDGRPLRPIQGDGGKILYVHGTSLPTIIGAPMRISDIELEDGERVNEILVGDSSRWLVESGTSGNGITHVFVKPVDIGLETSLVITTDKRVYHIQLVSREAGHTPYVGFLYGSQLQPVLRREAREREWRTALVDGQPVDMSNLNFHYTVKGDAPWKPAMVYDDGLKLYVRLPESARRTEVPALLVREGGETTLVNYRLRHNTFEVDGLFDHVILISGIGRKQRKVDITRDRRIAPAGQTEGGR
ncbi:MAG: P-type conjugative transfer protein TrbG [Deltaproteobacteria bacterium]|jgi:type IV secretion system protein VirB9|nr:P-type conjugative transfer protein TrbG [Deltaproteobacteria bacterium]